MSSRLGSVEEGARPFIALRSAWLVPFAVALLIPVAGIGLLATGLILWRAERRNPHLLDFTRSFRIQRWALPTFLIGVLLLATAGELLPPPFGAENPSLVLLGLVWAGCLILIFVHLRYRVPTRSLPP